MRDLVREYAVTPHDLVLPLFVADDEMLQRGGESLPGMDRLSIPQSVARARDAARLGIRAVAVFPVVAASSKDERASGAFDPDGIACRAIAAIAEAGLELGLIADVALDPYTSHGHDGLVERGDVVNDPTVSALCRMAVLLASAGADVVAPSDMMDGRVGRIRRALDRSGHQDVAILSYAAKSASSFYGPFRHAMGSERAEGSLDKRTYQLDPGNSSEALREARLDIAEGADIIMIKPALHGLDILRRVRDELDVPMFGYHVSGEYAMLCAAGDRGLLDWKSALHETLLVVKRAGADAIVTYAALEAAADLARPSHAPRARPS